MEPFDVHGENIVLVPLSASDAVDLTDALQDPIFHETTSIPYPFTLSMAEENLAKVPSKWEQGSADWAIRSAHDGRFLGRIELIRNTHFSDRYEVSYFVCHDEWGQGIATEAVSLALDTAFERLGASRVEWAAYVGNWGSWKAAWKNGFRKEGVARLPGYEAWVGGILATDPRTPASPWDGPSAGAPEILDSSRPQALVQQFHTTYFMPDRIRDHQEPTLDYERLHMRVSLIREEFAELLGALYGKEARAIVEEATQRAREADDGTRDIIETADALGDLVYVIYGMALESGIDLNRVLAEIQASNLSKLMPDGSVKLREDGKVLKGPNFFTPNIARALGQE